MANADAEKANRIATEMETASTERTIAHALLHPVRLDALVVLLEHTASPKEIAKLLRQPLGSVSHHVAELVKDDVVELVKEERRRGAVEHYYRAKVLPEIDAEAWKLLPMSSRRAIAAIALQAIAADGLASFRHQKMERDDDLYLVWMPMRLDEQGRKEVTDLQAEVLRRLVALKGESEARLSAGDVDTAPVRIVATMSFDRGRPGARHSGDILGIKDQGYGGEIDAFPDR